MISVGLLYVSFVSQIGQNQNVIKVEAVYESIFLTLIHHY